MTSKKEGKGAVQVAETKQGSDTKKKNSELGSVSKKITAPELPGSMKFMLSDETGEDKDLHGIQVTFLKRNVFETKMLVMNSTTNSREMLSPTEYEMYKEKRAIQHKVQREQEAAHGWVKKLATRCYLFVKPKDPAETIKFMNVMPVPKIVQGMMSFSQTEFSAKYPNPDAVLTFWLSVKKDDREAVSEYGQKLDVDFVDTLKLLNEAKHEREKRKAEKSARALASKAKGKISKPENTSDATHSTTSEQKHVSWQDKDEKSELDKNKEKLTSLFFEAFENRSEDIASRTEQVYAIKSLFETKELFTQAWERVDHAFTSFKAKNDVMTLGDYRHAIFNDVNDEEEDKDKEML